jgi:hypothetical protein
MKPIHDLLCQLQLIKSELSQVEIEQELRDNPRPTINRIPGLDLTWFDMSHPKTRSQILDEPELPRPCPAEERFSQLIEDLRVQIRATRVYLQHDAYPYLTARVGRIQKFEAALSRLEELSAGAAIQPGYYFPKHKYLFLRDEGDYCWDCAKAFISQTRATLAFACLLLSQRYLKLATLLWMICDRTGWWDVYYIRPYEAYFCKGDRQKTCDCCHALLHYSLTALGVQEEAGCFLDYEGEVDSTHWWQLWVIFDGVKEHNYPNYLGDSLEELIAKYKIDSPRTSVMEESCS